MTNNSRAHAREQQFQSLGTSLAVSDFIATRPMTETVCPAPSSSCTHLHPNWRSHSSGTSRTSLDAAMEYQYTCEGRAQLQRPTNVQCHQPGISAHRFPDVPSFELASVYGGAAPSCTTRDPVRRIGESRAVFIRNPMTSAIENVDGPEVGLDPSQYLNSKWREEQSHMASAGDYLFPDEAHGSFAPSAPPSMISGPSAMELAQPPTRQNSSYGGSAGANMMRFSSSQSHQNGDVPLRDSMQKSRGDDSCALSSAFNPDFLAIGSRFSGPSVGAYYPPVLFIPEPLSTDCSTSDGSLASQGTTSPKSDRRPQTVMGRTLNNGKINKIRSKMATTVAIVESVSSPAGKKHVSLPRAKAPYQRPKGPKMYCLECQEHPEGFRGDHELRRHHDAKHKPQVRKFVCCDPLSVGITPEVSPFQSLSDCKSCSGGKKYGADYNAAAHLRRVHFKPKVSRGPRKTASGEKRAGKGGGNWPPMHLLRPYLEEVHVVNGTDDHGTSPLMQVDETNTATDTSGWMTNLAEDVVVPDHDGGFDGKASSAHQPMEDPSATERVAFDDDSQMTDISHESLDRTDCQSIEFFFPGDDTLDFNAAFIEAAASSGPSSSFYSQGSDYTGGGGSI